MNNKECYRCKETKLITEFSRTPINNLYKYNNDGYLRVCKECTNKKLRARYHVRVHIDKIKKVYTEKDRVRHKTRYAINNGELIRDPCEVCGEKKVDAHHNDYSNYLDITWLCRKCHMRLHNKLREERNDTKICM